MKKLIFVLIGLCLIAAVVFGVVSMRGGSATEAEPAGTDPVEAGWDMDEIGPLEETESAADAMTGAVTPAPEAAAEPVKRVDFEALYALHDSDEKVLSIGDREESWGDYFYLLYTQSEQIENYFDSMAAYYGMRFSWDDPVEEDGKTTYAEAVVESAGNLLKQLTALETFAAENKVEISEEMRAIIEKQKQEDISSVLGEEGTQEAFFEYLEGIYLSPEMYDRAVTQNVLYQECFNTLYGQNAEKVSKETALNFLNENGYVSAAHILFLYNDPETGEVRDEETLAANKTKLESLVKELRGYTDQRARAKAFLQKAADLSEDSGKAYYPEGYTYTPGTMVPQFEDAVSALAEYEISGVVETDYGYHVIMRLPLSADAVVELNNSTGEPRTARMLSANKDYGERLQTLSDSLSIEWLPGCEAPVLTDFIH
ncbi:MAG: peptidylprolyl isomerase [Oscillospiraceae bacterium]|nr:peptidylprolyl isomerase [Oscillospiraceae bacterium]